GKDTHDHKWGSWTVSTQPTNEATCKATRACTGEGTCDAKATEKEATLPVLTSTVYAVTNDTATCQAAGTGTYTYNKNGVNVSFTAATPVNASNHTDTCGHNQTTPPAPTGHSHVWSEWEIDDDAALGVAFAATRTCTGAGTCDADESLTTVTVPSPLYGDEYEYDAPVHKTDATCLVQGADTYTYKDTENNITISFDVYTGYGDHVFENNECSVCGAISVTAALNTEVTINATSDKVAKLEFTAATAGRYQFIYTAGSDTDANINNNTIRFPASFDLAAEGKRSFEIKSPVDEENPEQATSATYKIKVIPVTVLEPTEDEDNADAAYETPSTVSVNVGNGKSVRLDVDGNDYGIISYTGANAITLTGGYIHHLTGSWVDLDPITLSEEGDTSYVVNFSDSYYRSFEFTVSSEAGEAFDAEISLLLSEDDPNPDAGNVLTLEEPKSFAMETGWDILVYKIEISVPASDYVIEIGGDDAAYITVGTKVNGFSGEIEEGAVEANPDGTYEFEAGTYYIVVQSDVMDDGGNYLPISGTITVR
ncbi:MAG: hypothetical protein K2J61_01900, partial [Clostridia bacterium]|nr:hypothetical protein [Clostridia bacterium]